MIKLRQLLFLLLSIVLFSQMTFAQNSADVNGYTFTFNGATVNGGNTTFSYTITALGTADRDISHYNLGMCDDITNSDIIAVSSGNDWDLTTDQTTTDIDWYGLKFDEGMSKQQGTTKNFWVTLKGVWDVAPVNVGYKAGSQNQGTNAWSGVINGPSCSPPQPADNKIGNYIWHDSNANGLQDDSEGLEGVVVELINSSNQSSFTTTNASGYYEFTGLDNGTYTVKVASSNFSNGGVLFSTANEKWYASPANVGSNDAIDSDGNQATTTLNNNDDLTLDFGFYKTGIAVTKTASVQSAQVGDVITYTIVVTNTGDITHSGGVDVFDAMIFSPNPYHIDKLFPGTSETITRQYTVTANDCGELINTVRADGHPINGSAKVSAQAQATVTINCFSSIGDKVWIDANENGIQDNGELGLEGVTVKLFNCNNQFVAETTTNASGNYSFTGITPGDYYVQFILPNGYTFTSKDSGSNDALDSDADQATGKTACTTLDANENDLTFDAGLVVKKASIGDKVWNDVNENGIQDNGELGIENVTVKLYTCDDTFVAETTTNANGNYVFTNVAPGDYYVKFVLPAGYNFTAANQGGNDLLDSDANISTGKTDCTTLDPNENDLTFDAGLVIQKASIGDKVWNDANGNGIQDNGELGFENVTVKLYTCDDQFVAETTTNANGVYGFANLNPGDYYVKFILPNGYTFTSKDSGTNDALDSDADLTTGKTDCTTLTPGENDVTFDAGLVEVVIPKASIGDKVWNDANGNGIQDNGELGLENVTVKLYTCDDQFVAETTTNANGVYSFTNINSGDYYILFVLPNGYTFTSKDSGTNNGIDSDADQTSGKTDCTNLAPGENDLTWDAGLQVIVIPKSSIGDKVWNDTNENGIQDNGELGIENVTVKLYNCDNQFVAETTTNSDGNYLFSDLTAGDYYVKFILPSGYTFTSKDSGTNDALDSDADQTTGKTECTTLDPNENDLTFDAGLVEIPSVDKASLGDKVWYDTNENGVQDNGELGINNITVDLYDCNGQFIMSTTTNSNGIYSFTDLTPGDYKVKFNLPNNHVFTIKDAFSDDNVDSDAKTNGYTVCITLAPGENNLSVDAGMFIPSADEVDIQIEKTASSYDVENGETVTFTITAKNIGSGTATNVSVSDVLPAGLDYFSASTNAYDESTGIWTIGTLVPSETATLTITTTVNVDLSNSSMVDFGIAAPYNVFVFGDVNQPSSDTEGKMAVGRDAYLSSYSVGDKIVSTNGYEDVLIVNRDFTLGTGRIYGNVVYGRNITANENHIDGEMIKGNPIDFAAAESYLNSLSAQLRQQPANGSTTVEWGQLNLVGTDPYINVFNVSESDFTSTHTKVVDAPSGSVVIVNVAGQNLSWTGGLSVSGTTRQQVIYNFYQATNLQISGIAVEGSILAPKAHVQFWTGQQNGQMIAKSLEGSGQFNNSLFVGSIPVNQEIVNIASLLSVDQIDINSNNNSSSAVINVSSDDPGNGNGNGNGTGETDNNWQLVGSFDATEIVWSMTTDENGNKYIGTIGGNIYKIDGNNEKTLMNEDMNVGWIWSLFVDTDGKIYAGTEQGIFRSNENQTTWTQKLVGTDVRSLVKVDRKLYIGTWGGGVYKLNFNTEALTAVNDGLDILSVHALVSDSKGDIYAGTMGGGVYKYESNTWTKLEVGYNFIWSLAITSDDKLVAATYGDGVYGSFDYGQSWEKINNGLAAQFVYAVSVDQDDNIYASTWAGGVYKLELTNKTNSWKPVGMGGYGVSSIMFNNSEEVMYVGTRDGQIFKKTSSLTGLGEESEIPTEFNLAQNYPNPFNPTTKIEFSIPKAGAYSLVVYNILGQEVRVLANEEFQPGKYTVDFNATDLTSGIYIYRFIGQDVNYTKKMVLIK